MLPLCLFVSFVLPALLCWNPCVFILPTQTDKGRVQTQTKTMSKNAAKKEKKDKMQKKKKVTCWAEPRYFCFSSSGGGVKRKRDDAENTDRKEAENADRKEAVADREGVARVFVDGSCTGNQQLDSKKRKGGCGVYCETTKWELSGPLEEPCTNNRGELTAVILVLEEALQGRWSDQTEIRVVGDNIYVLKIITEWLDKWRRNNYCKSNGEEILNKDLVQRLDSLLQQAAATHVLSFLWVSAHCEEPENKKSELWLNWYGNKKADELAQAGSAVPSASVPSTPASDSVPSWLSS